MINLANLTRALPQVMQVLGSVQNGDLNKYIENLCKTQNIPLDSITKQAQGIINMVGEQNLRQALAQLGLRF